MNVHDLKALMGHSGLEMLMRYMDNDAKNAHKAFGAVDGTLRARVSAGRMPRTSQSSR